MGCGASSKAAGGEGKTGEAPAPEAPPKTEPAAPPKEPTPATGTTEPQKPAVAPEKPAEPAPTEPEKPAPPPEKPAEPAPTEPEKPSVSRSLDGCVIATHATFEGEYFYATLYDDGEGRRRVASWMSGGNPEEDPQSKWIIKTMEDGTLVITSAHFEGNYLYACANDDGEGRRYVKCWMNGGAAEEDPQARWAAKELADGSFTITSVLYEGNYLYAGGESLADGEGRRPVYCWMNGGEAAVDTQAKWKISAAAAPAAPAAAPAEEAPPPAEEAPPPAEEAPPAAEEAPAAEPEAPPAEPEATEAPAAEAEPASSGCFIITNPTFEGEYFYATLKDDGEGRRQVNQWMSGGDPEADPQSKWCMKEMEDGTLLITHAHFQGNYLYAANSDDGEGRRYVYAWMGGGAAEDDPQARWIMTKKEDGTCYITSKEYEGNYLYAANKDDGDGRRSVFCWSNGGAPEDDPQAIWTIAPAVAAPEPA